MNKQLRRTRLTGIVFLGVVAIALFYFVIGPRFSLPEQIQAQVDQALSDRALLDQQLSVLTNRASSMDIIQGEADRLAQLLPADASISQLNQQVTEAAAASGMQSDQVTLVKTGTLTAQTPTVSAAPAAAPAPSGEATQAPAAAPAAGTPTGLASSVSLDIYEMTVDIQAYGTFEQMSAFASNLTTAGRAMKINRINITLAGDNVNYAITVEAVAYAVRAIGPAPVPQGVPVKAKPSPTALPTPTTKATATTTPTPGAQTPTPVESPVDMQTETPTPTPEPTQ